MASKLIIHLLFLATICFNPFITFSFAHQESCPPPTVHIRNKNVLGGVTMIIKGGAPAVVKPGEEYRLAVDVAKGVYNAMAYDSRNRFASFNPYEPERDKGHAEINWKVDRWGFSLSYDKRNWTKDTPWDTE